MKANSFIKKTAAISLSIGLLASPANSVLIPEATATGLKTEDILSSLTVEQRKALKQLELQDHTGLQGFKAGELEEDKKVSVIVQFKSKPSKVAVLEAAAKGKKLNKEKANTQVEKEHKTFKEDIKKILPKKNAKGKSISNDITQTYKTAYNGVAMNLPANQVELLMKSEVVQAVYKNQTFTVDPVKKDLPKDVDREITTSVESIPYLKIDELHKEGITGEGVKVAVLDTGIDYNHPDLKEAYKGGYDFVDEDQDPMEATYKDWENTNEPEYAPWGSSYYTSHGTHVSGTIVGQNVNDSEVSVQGVAPDADLYVYRVLGPYGSGTTEDVLAGIEKSIEDGMDVINLSLGADINDPYYPTSTAINYAVLNGVTAVVAAGNAGPEDYTVGSPGTAALALTVGASDVPMSQATFTGRTEGDWSTDIVSMGRSFADDFAKLEGTSLELVDVGLGNSQDYTGKEVEGKIAFVQRGEFALNDKIKFAKEHGAAAVIMYNNEEGHVGYNLGESTDFVPAFSMTKAAGEQLKAAIAIGKTTFTFDNFETIKTEGDKLADFSSRGPVRGNYDMKPEVVAPGVSVLSTYPSFMIDHENTEDYKYAYARLNGTSMATPHTAGIAALLLDANPGLDPDDIKTILMNTAEPLNGEYSVFEVGAGRVDPYQAVHSQMKVQVKDETLIPDGEELVAIENPTGGISFGQHFGEAGNHIRVMKSLNFTNNSDKTKTFEVSIEENVIEGTNSLKENGVKVSSSKKIKVKANKEKKNNVFLTVPKSAKTGVYEGYIILTNKANSAEQYRVPFNFRVTEEGFNYLEVFNPALSPFYLNNGFDGYRNRVMFVDFNLSSPMAKMDVILQDGETGKDLGFIGTVDLKNSSENINLGLMAFQGMYNKFTGDSKQPISQEVSYAQPGHYKLKFITTGLSGKVITETRDVFIDLDDPKFESSLDESGSPFLEYKPGQETYPFEIQINDSHIEKMQEVGIDVDQSSNFMVYTWNSPFPSAPIYMDKGGKFVDEIALDESVPALSFTMDGYDMAGNKGLRKQYYFVQEGTAVTYAKSEEVEANTGDTVHAKLVLDNLNEASKAEWTFGEIWGVKSVELVDAKLTDSFADKATLKVDGDKVTVQFDEASGALDHSEVVEVTLKVQDEQYIQQAEINPTVEVTNINNGTVSVLNAGDKIKISPQFNRVYGNVLPEGFFVGSEGSEYLDKKDWSKVGASVKLMDTKGNEFDASSSIDNARYTIEKLPLSKDPYTLEMKVPGHFVTKSEEQIGFEHNGKLIGMNHGVNPINLTAGDVNQDNVIDVLDAIDIQEAWKTDNRAADINFDGTVDSKDIKYVQSNYLKQNGHVENAPEPKEEYDGNTLESILEDLGVN
ncbi:S8 family serine peptidase [Rossellomorea sp. BNER]|uniref:S8 family serine peptidase n=1 Tax=Rossellomorea sp. BNER TaxID=2962031 RepID=UPI003AF1F028|nr:S8 family serine peptidase [Rossellomorea sp. BNER]